MSGAEKSVPAGTKRLVSSKFGFERPLTPLSRRRSSIEGALSSPPKLEKKAQAMTQDTWEKFKASTRLRVKLWIGSSIVFGVWLLALTVMYSMHMETANHTVDISVTNQTLIMDGECVKDSDCPASMPYCDTLNSHKCSYCISSSQCTSASKPVCDTYGSRSCHECIVDHDCTGSMVCDSSNTRTCAQCFGNRDCASNAAKSVCYSGNNTCQECATNSDCSANAVNTVCLSTGLTCQECETSSDCAAKYSVKKACFITNHTCYECTSNADCTSDTSKPYCDLGSFTCAAPCTSTICAARADNKTKCCGTQCIEDCGAGTICDVFQGTCVTQTTGTPKGTNVFTNYSTPNFTGCGHCHESYLNVTGSMFNRTMLDTIGYLTGIEYMYTYPTNTAPSISNAKLYYQEAPNCVSTDFMTRSFIELGSYTTTITQNLVNFTNVLPVTSQCFFILTQGIFNKDFSCDASNNFTYQVASFNNGTIQKTIAHTPYYKLYGY